MNHFYDSVQRQRKNYPSNESRENIKRPKLITGHSQEISTNKSEFLKDSSEKSKNFFFNYYNSNKASDDRIMSENTNNFSNSASSKSALYEKYIKELGNYKRVVSSSGINITPCCKGDNKNKR